MQGRTYMDGSGQTQRDFRQHVRQLLLNQLVAAVNRLGTGGP
jgi:hypothetical protein